MRDGLVTTQPSHEASLASRDPQSDLGATLPPAPHPLERPLAALRRYKWLIAVIVVLSAALGVAGTRLITPQYEVRATVWIAAETPEARTGVGPIRSGELLRSGAWIELFRSYRIVDQVVRKLALFLAPANPAQAPIFTGFELADRFAPGSYELQIDRAKKTWVLRTKQALEVERGVADDSVGRKVGFKWKIPWGAFDGKDILSVPFTVSTPREMSIRILDRIGNRLTTGSNFLWLTYKDPDPKLAARTLNTWVEEYVHVAADLKRRNVVEFANILEGQLLYAEKATQDAESAYQSFRVNAITLPTEGGPVAAGAVSERDRDPALNSFFEQKIAHDNLRHDREALEKSIASAAANSVPYEGLLLIPSVAQSPGAEALREAFRNRYQLKARLTAERQNFTDEYPTVKELKSSLAVLENQTIPGLASQLLSQLKERELDYERRIKSASKDLQAIPPRTIEERRLNRAVVVSEGLYTNLKSRYAEAKLAEASATPDVSVLDTAVAPLSPTKNTARMVVLLAIVAGLGAAIGLALLLDQLDGKFRYADQAAGELQLSIAGAVPRIPKRGIRDSSPEQVVQFVESFRTLRMHVMHSARNDRLKLAVTSAAPGDGKSLISSNLALSCADAGLRTVLVDGDTRRGTLHKMFGLPGKGGLTEYLVGSVAESQIVKNTSYANLFFVSCGRRDSRSPEMLASPKLKSLVEHLSRTFDVVIFDTPPLAAGIDAYAISAAMGNVLMVLRMGRTERRLAANKLAVIDRLPVDILGAVLNEVSMKGEFQYYAYSSGYSIDAGEGVGELVGSGSR